MFRSYFVAALRNIARNKLYVAINTTGLAVGIATAILIGLFARDEFSFDRFIPGGERVFLLSEIEDVPNQAQIFTPTSQSSMAAWMRLDFPQIDGAARLMPSQHSLRQGDFEANEKVYWADPNIFSVLPLKVVAGDLGEALSRPDSLVVTRQVARKYFHRDAPIGETIQIDRTHVMTITAVLQDLPATTHMDVTIIGSAAAPFSELAALDASPPGTDWSTSVYTYFRLKSGASVERLKPELPQFFARHLQAMLSLVKVSLVPVAIQDIHLTAYTQKTMRPGGDLTTIYAVLTVGVLIMLVAIINFVNLMTARAGRRAIEVLVRKTAGSRRRDLVVQFIGEAILHAALATAISIVLVELTLPKLNAFLGRDILFEYALFMPALLVTAVIVGLLAGAYPALVLSGYSPLAVIRGLDLSGAASTRLRTILVTIQFATLTGLILATGVIYRQSMFAMNEGLRVDKDEVLLVSSTCSAAFQHQIARLKGVRATACSSPTSLNLDAVYFPFKRADGTTISLSAAGVGFGFFELYGLRATAGRLFSEDHGGDTLPLDYLSGQPTAQQLQTETARIILNESAARKAGFAEPRDAIGKTLLWFETRRAVVVGVVPDFSFDTIHKTIAPTVYAIIPFAYRYLNIKLTGHDVPEALVDIDRTWRQLGDPRPIERFFLEDHMQELYVDVTRRATVFSAFSAVAVLIACLGLFGLSAYIAERRTREIGIRKATGAGRMDIIKLLTWEFAKPVLVGIALAWVATGILMSRWLATFAYHVALEPWLFAASALIALGIAMATVGVHSYAVSGIRPSDCLRYD